MILFLTGATLGYLTGVTVMTLTFRGRINREILADNERNHPTV